MVGDIPMCADAAGTNADQRFNGIAYNSKKNEFLASWTDTRAQIKNVAIMGRIVKADGTMPADDFALVDAPGAQMVSHTHYVEGDDAYFVAFERDRNDVDKFYFKDIKANLDIGAQWLDSTRPPERAQSSIFSAARATTALCALPTAKKAMRSYWSGKAISRAYQIQWKVTS